MMEIALYRLELNGIEFALQNLQNVLDCTPSNKLIYAVDTDIPAFVDIIDFVHRGYSIAGSRQHPIDVIITICRRYSRSFLIDNHATLIVPHNDSLESMHLVYVCYF